jgi:hypothetical protein
MAECQFEQSSLMCSALRIGYWHLHCSTALVHVCGDKSRELCARRLAAMRPRANVRTSDAHMLTTLCACFLQKLPVPGRHRSARGTWCIGARCAAAAWGCQHDMLHGLQLVCSLLAPALHGQLRSKVTYAMAMASC